MSAASSGESRRAVTSATTVRRATLPTATGGHSPVVTPPEVPASRGLFLRDLQDLFSQRHRTDKALVAHAPVGHAASFQRVSRRAPPTHAAVAALPARAKQR